MFKIGDIISVSKKGICEVENISKDVFEGCDKTKLYYTLKPINNINNMIVYLPVDTTLAMRKIISKQKASDALDEIKAENAMGDLKENERQDVNNKVIQSGNFDEWLELLKTLAHRKNTLQKKMFGLYEQKQFSSLIEIISNEISIALGEEVDVIKIRISEKLEQK